ncbi:MAG: hypothetical protein ACOVMN_09865, partial [Flexibacteraceae bacterium]
MSFTLEQWRTLQHTVVESYPYVTITEGQTESYPYGQFQWFIAASNTAITKWEQVLSEPNYLFGYLGYDLKNHLEDLNSANSQLIAFPECMVFEPEFLASYQDGKVTILIGELPSIIAAENNLKRPTFQSPKSLTSQSEYEEKVKAIREYIRQGEVYELNYCIGFRTKAEDFESPIDFWHFQS